MFMCPLIVEWRRCYGKNTARRTNRPDVVRCICSRKSRQRRFSLLDLHYSFCTLTHHPWEVKTSFQEVKTRGRGALRFLKYESPRRYSWTRRMFSVSVSHDRRALRSTRSRIPAWIGTPADSLIFHVQLFIECPHGYRRLAEIKIPVGEIVLVSPHFVRSWYHHPTGRAKTRASVR